MAALTCAACGKAAEGNYSVHRDGFCSGPEVPLCDDCGRMASQISGSVGVGHRPPREPSRCGRRQRTRRS